MERLEGTALDEKYPLSAQRLRAIIETIPANVFFKDSQGRYQIVSHVCQMINDASGSIIGKTDLEVQPDPELGRRFYEEDLQIARTGVDMSYLQEMRFGDATFYYQISKMPVFDAGEVVGIVGIVQDMTENVKLQMALQKSIETDSLTGAATRSYYNALLEGEEPLEVPTAVIMADCNRLKQVNDTFGHTTGDTLLVLTVENVRDALPPRGQIIRLGGDEFLILVPDCDEEACKRLIADLRSRECRIHVQGMPLSTAYGYAIMHEPGQNLEAIIYEADQRMYQDKARIKAQ